MMPLPLFPTNELSLLRSSEIQRVIDEPVAKNALYFNRDEFGDNCMIGLAKKHKLTPTEADELYKLLDDMLPLGFTRSNQLSNYIVRHKLGHKYPNISGIVRMMVEGTEWDFQGGFPPWIYAIICDELELTNQGTRARAVGFISFKEMQSRVMRLNAGI